MAQTDQDYRRRALLAEAKLEQYAIFTENVRSVGDRDVPAKMVLNALDGIAFVWSPPLEVGAQIEAEDTRSGEVVRMELMEDGMWLDSRGVTWEPKGVALNCKNQKVL